MGLAGLRGDRCLPLGEAPVPGAARGGQGRRGEGAPGASAFHPPPPPCSRLGSGVGALRGRPRGLAPGRGAWGAGYPGLPGLGTEEGWAHSPRRAAGAAGSACRGGSPGAALLQPPPLAPGRAPQPPRALERPAPALTARQPGSARWLRGQGRRSSRQAAPPGRARRQRTALRHRRGGSAEPDAPPPRHLRIARPYGRPTGSEAALGSRPQMAACGSRAHRALRASRLRIAAGDVLRCADTADLAGPGGTRSADAGPSAQRQPQRGKKPRRFLTKADSEVRWQSDGYAGNHCSALTLSPAPLSARRENRLSNASPVCARCAPG